MKKADARQSSLIQDCGCNPDHFMIIGEDPGWIHTINTISKIVTHFDLERKMPCFTEEISMHYRKAEPGYRYILTKRGELSLSEIVRGGAVQGQSIKGRETSVPVKWWKDKYVIEENENDHEEKTRGISQH